jgi:hypothetical protein
MQQSHWLQRFVMIQTSQACLAVALLWCAGYRKMKIKVKMLGLHDCRCAGGGAKQDEPKL